MNNPKTSPALDALQELASIRDLIRGAQQQLKQGKMPNMAELEGRTAAVCATIQQASAELQKKCAPELKDIVSQLDDCEKDLHRFYGTAVAPEKK